MADIESIDHEVDVSWHFNQRQARTEPYYFNTNA